MRFYQTISCSVTGYRKKMDHLACEDATRVLHTKKGTVVAVADGHGDKRCLFASVGAKLATRAACDVLKSYLRSATGNIPVYWNGSRRAIAEDIAKKFACYVLNDYRSRCKDRITDQEYLELRRHIRDYFKSSEKAMSPADLRAKYYQKKRLDDLLGQILFLYGTTVRASVLTDAYLFNCALGDGDTVAVIDGRVEWLLPQAEAYRCETASLCEPFEEVVDSFLFSFVECQGANAPSSDVLWDVRLFVPTVLLATDGLRNSFLSTSLFEKKVRELADAIQMGPKEVRSSDLKRLYDKLSMESVFQDDISTIFITRMKKA